MTSGQLDELARPERKGSIALPARSSQLTPGWPLLDAPRWRRLCEIGTLLIRPADAEATIPAVLTLVAQTLPLRSAIFILCDRAPVWIFWPAVGVREAQMRAAKAIAQRCYDYFMSADVKPFALPDVSAEWADHDQPGTLVRLPLVVEHSGSLGVCQLESSEPLSEMDLEFLSAVALQVARSLDRQAIIERQQNIAERRRAEAVERQLHAEARQARAEAEARAAKAERLRVELGRATAEALRDQAERRRLFAEEMRDRYRSLLDNADGAFFWEVGFPSLRIGYVSAGAEELLGFPRARWLDEPNFLLERVYPKERAAVAEMLQQAQAGGDHRCEHRFVSEEGRVSWFHTGVRRGGAGAHLLGISVRLVSGPHVPQQQVVDAARSPPPPVSDELERTQRAVLARDELLAAVSHDLKGPLNVILLTTASMTALPSNEPCASELEHIRRAAQRMDTLVRELLDSARLEAGRLPLQPRAVAPSVLVDQAIATLLPLARARLLQLEALTAADLPDVSADPSRILQVLENLIGNAIKFSPPGGDILVGAARAGRSVRFSVRDIGAGIPADEIPHLFDRFWQPQRTAGQGTGLGLSIARGIVLAHGGRIWAESRVGMGSTFYFTLPAA